MIGSLTTFTEGLNKKGTLANELTTDTVVFNSLKLLRVATPADRGYRSCLGCWPERNKLPIPTRRWAYCCTMKQPASGLKETLKNLESSSVEIGRRLARRPAQFPPQGLLQKERKRQVEIRIVRLDHALLRQEQGCVLFLGSFSHCVGCTAIWLFLPIGFLLWKSAHAEDDAAEAANPFMDPNEPKQRKTAQQPLPAQDRQALQRKAARK
jgi:hypothetical protein